MTVLLGPRSLFLGVVVLIAAALGSWLIWRLVDRDSDPSVPDMHPTAELIARGEYLTRAADCAACHNAPGGKPFSGGLAFKLPFGKIYSTNITADRETGIGTWSDDDFVRASSRNCERRHSSLSGFPLHLLHSAEPGRCRCNKGISVQLAVRARARPAGRSDLSLQPTLDDALLESSVSRRTPISA